MPKQPRMALMGTDVAELLSVRSVVSQKTPPLDVNMAQPPTEFSLREPGEVLLEPKRIGRKEAQRCTKKRATFSWLFACQP